MDSIFEAQLSPQGNMKREQEAILFNFTNFMEEVEKGKIKCVGENELHITIGDILGFITGATNIPALGFEPTPNIEFDHYAPPGWKLTANTCANVIRFPVNDTLTTYNSFKQEMCLCLQGCQGFGML